MRRVMLVAVVGVAACFVQAALGQDQMAAPGCASCGQRQQVRTYAARGCDRHDYGGVPGCCRCGPSKCDHVWDGFCDEKARCKQRLRETFWFLPGGRSYEVTECQPAVSGIQVVVEPATAEMAPAVAPQLQEMPAEPAPADPQPAAEPKPPEEEPAETTRWPWIPRFW